MRFHHGLRDKTAVTMSHHEQRQVVLLAAVVKHGQLVVDVVCPHVAVLVAEAVGCGGKTVSAVVVHHYDVSAAVEVACKVVVACGVLHHAVGNLDNRLGRRHLVPYVKCYFFAVVRREIKLFHCVLLACNACVLAAT